MKHILLKLIRAYQKTLSPDHGLFRARFPHGFCRFHPSCSEYAYKAIEQHGVVKGVWYALLRVGRCNPFVSPRVDQVPNN